jgi:hypothetical protein
MVGDTVLAALPAVVVLGNRDVQLAGRNAIHADAQG